MALVIAKKADEPISTMKFQVFDLTFTGVTGGLIETGLNQILSAIFSNRITEAAGIVYPNFGDAGVTAANGKVYVDSVNAADEGTLTVFGR
jgi:hypothetical protein